MSYFIKSQADNSNFLEVSEKLLSMSVALIDEDREFGLQALITIAKTFADLDMFEKAMDTTQLAETLRNSKNCDRNRNHDDDIDPFQEMGEYMLGLNQYKLAEECAKKLDASYTQKWIYYGKKKNPYGVIFFTFAFPTPAAQLAGSLCLRCGLQREIKMRQE